MMRSRLFAGFVLVTLLAILALSGYSCIQKREIDRLKGQVNSTRAELAGANKALSVKPKEVVRLVEKEVPVEVVKLIKEKVLVPVASGNISTNVETVPIPLTDLKPAQQTLDVGVSLKGWFLLTTTKQGDPFWNGELSATLSNAAFSKDVIFDRHNSNVEIRTSTEITKALKDHASERRFAFKPRPFNQWRTGWSVGGGLAYEPIDHRIAPVVAVVWGIQL